MSILRKFLDGKNSKVFLFCFIAYTVSYFARMNLSVALVDIVKMPGLNETLAGVIGTAYFWIYAAGQLVNGAIGDKIKPYYIVFAALVVAGLANIGFAFSTSFLMMMIFWSINGFFQAMLWAPITKMLGDYYSPKVKNFVATSMTITTILGHLAVWFGLSMIAEVVTYVWLFLIPAFIVIGFAFIWIIGLYKESKTELNINNNLKVKKPNEKEVSQVKTITLFKDVRMIMYMLATIMQGMIKEGVTLWLPTIVVTYYGVSQANSGVYMILTPVIGTIGAVGSALLFNKFKSKLKTVKLLFFIAAICAFVGFVFDIPSVFIIVLIISIISGAITGINNILVAVMPLEYVDVGKTATVAGMLNFCGYLGAGISAILTGSIMAIYGFRAVLGMWLVICVLGLLMMMVSQFIEKRR